ncbi:MAG: hypothetical protein R3B49_06335 [Phycisphaerales bacterium]
MVSLLEKSSFVRSATPNASAGPRRGVLRCTASTSASAYARRDSGNAHDTHASHASSAYARARLCATHTTGCHQNTVIASSSNHANQWSPRRRCASSCAIMPSTPGASSRCSAGQISVGRAMLQTIGARTPGVRIARGERTRRRSAISSTRRWSAGSLVAPCSSALRSSSRRT